MKVAFDSDVLLDAIVNRAHAKEAQQLIMAVPEERLEGVITANSITDIYYIAHKSLSDGKTRDALLAVCVKRDGTDYIVTRDEAF